MRDIFNKLTASAMIAGAALLVTACEGETETAVEEPVVADEGLETDLNAMDMNAMDMNAMGMDNMTVDTALENAAQATENAQQAIENAQEVAE